SPAASQEQNQYAAAHGNVSKQVPTFGGSWGRSPFSVELTPEEAATREKIGLTPPIPSARIPVARDLRYGNNPVSPDWYCGKCRTSNDRAHNSCQKCNWPKQHHGGLQWQCTSCGWHNPGQGTRCTKCNSFNADETQTGGIANQWKHVKRYGRDHGPIPPLPDAKLNFGIYDAPPARDWGHREERLQDERRRRLEQTREGRFVGFRSRRPHENYRFGLEETQARNLRNQNPADDQPLIRRTTFRGRGPVGVEQSAGPAYTQRNQDSDREAVIGSSPRFSVHGYPHAGQRSAESRPSYGSSQSFGSSWNAYDSGETGLSDQERTQRPAPAHETTPTATSHSPRNATQYIPVGGTEQATEQTAPADTIKDATTQNVYQLPQDVDEPSLRIFPQDGRSRIRSKPRDLDSAPSSTAAANAAAPYHNEGRPRRSRRARLEYEEEADEYDEDREEARRKRKEQRKRDQTAQKRAQPPTPIYLPEFISVGNLARVIRVRVEEFGKKMQQLGFEETNNDHLLDAETAGLIAAEFNFEAVIDTSGEAQDLQARAPVEDKSLLPPRPPIVTIMGHVDHGKTTLLDYLRRSSVAASEHGGITQHIGAFSVPMPGGRLITFLDTPGHAAFLSMRQRGANVTDIVVLVVAADDSVKPQTIEAIKHAQAAKVPMIVAINKVDKEDKNIDRVKQDLARYNVEIEDFGGETQVVCVSGKTGQGLDELEENIVALADILDMRAEADGQAEGWVLEAATKKAGRVATVLVKRGTIGRGDIIVAGSTWAKIKTLKNEAGVQVQDAGPGTPVEVDGWKDQPAAGDEVLQAISEQQAKSAIDFRLAKAERERLAVDMTAVNESRRLEQEKRDALAAADTNSSMKSESATATSPTDTQSPSSTTTDPSTSITLPIVLKADVSGSVEACLNAITALGTSSISPHVVRSAVGTISESDIAFAASSGAHIVSFNQKTTPEISRLAEREGVKLVEENIIYRLSDLVKGNLQDLLPEKVEIRVLGEAEIAKGFEIGIGGRKKMMVAGCKVRNGLVSRTNKVRVLREGEGGEVVFDGALSSLKNVKKD
ncbi:MAG: hypothetical protein L6R39_007753, partial [Caloplaca ligustica]